MNLISLRNCNGLVSLLILIHCTNKLIIAAAAHVAEDTMYSPWQLKTDLTQVIFPIIQAISLITQAIFIIIQAIIIIAQATIINQAIIKLIMTQS